MESNLQHLEVEQEQHGGDGEEDQDAPHRHAHVCSISAKGEEALAEPSLGVTKGGARTVVQDHKNGGGVVRPHLLSWP